MTTPPPGEEPPVGESLWVDADWWRAMTDAEAARADEIRAPTRTTPGEDDDAALALGDPLTDPLPIPEIEEPGPEPLPAAEPAPKSNDLHVPRVLPERSPEPAAPAPEPQRAGRVLPPIAPRAPARRDRRRLTPAVKSRLGDLLLLLLAIGVVALVYFALTR